MGKKAQNLIEFLLIGALVSVVSLAVLTIFNQQKHNSVKLTDTKKAQGVNNQKSENIINGKAYDPKAAVAVKGTATPDLIVEVGGSNAVINPNNPNPNNPNPNNPNPNDPNPNDPNPGPGSSNPSNPPSWMNPSNIEVKVFGNPGVGSSGITSGG